MKGIVSIVSVLLFILVGCGQAKQTATLEEPKMLNVTVTFTPKQIKVNEPFTIQAHVTYGEEKVNDASEVIFEFWKQGQENHEMISAVKGGEGIYELKKEVSEAGTYSVISHVTAKNMHNMPKVDFQVVNK